MTYDAVIIGAGLAGLTAALRIAEEGRRVVVVARGVGATHLAPATVDVLGYVGNERVDSPATSLTKLLEARPDHPYRLVTRERLDASLSWFGKRVAALEYSGSLDANQLFTTAIGVAKPSAYAPRTMTGGDLRSGGHFVFVGFRGFKDFHPALLADNLVRAQLPVSLTARGIEIDLPAERIRDIGGRRLAERFDSNHYSDWLVASLANKIEPDEIVGLPAVLGLRRAGEILSELEQRLERRVFEVPTLPPSIAGIRLFDALTAALRAAGVRLVLGANAVGARAHDGRIDNLEVRNASGIVSYPAESVVLASGGFASGGLELDSRGTTRETVFGLPVAGIPQGDQARFRPGYFEEQPFASAGLAVDDRLRPVDRDGKPVYSNLHAAGAILGGAVPWKEKSGTGISVATGFAVAESITGALVPAAAEPVR
jgi:glycerol-3-phosphate dehydrogenase subunit B